jgi:lipopolysaccharide export system protein LptA
MARTLSPTLAGAALMLSCVLGAAAQPAGQAQQPASTTQGLSMDSDQPVRIESNTLEVRDKIRQAIFAGDVKLTQGDTTIKCKVLVVFYEDTAAPSKKNAPPAPAAGQPAQKTNQKIKRAECKGDVFVVQKEQAASGDNAVFEMKSNTVEITGKVVLTQGPTVTRGDRMVSNLTTGITNIYSTPVAPAGKGEPPKGPTRVEVLMQPGAKDVKATPVVPAQPAPAAAPPPSAKAAPKGGPLRLN